MIIDNRRRDNKGRNMILVISHDMILISQYMIIIIWGKGDQEVYFQKIQKSFEMDTSSYDEHPVARWSPMLGEEHFATSWIWAGYI